MTMRAVVRRTVMAAVLLLLLFPAPWALAAGPMDEGMPGPHQPLVTRDAAPETKLEVMFGAAKSSMGRMYELALAAEYAPIHSFSVELELPLALRDPREGPTVAGPGDLALTAKVAPLMLGAQDTVVALGLTLGLPTGSERRELGGELSLTPFVAAAQRLGPVYLHGDIGYRWRLDSPRRIEMDTESEMTETVQPEKEQALTANLAGSYISTPWLGLFLELNSVTLFKGDPELKDRTQLYLTPGVTVEPAKGWNVRAGVQLPLTNAREFDYQIGVAVMRSF